MRRRICAETPVLGRKVAHTEFQHRFSRSPSRCQRDDEPDGLVRIDSRRFVGRDCAAIRRQRQHQNCDNECSARSLFSASNADLNGPQRAPRITSGAASRWRRAVAAAPAPSHHFRSAPFAPGRRRFGLHQTPHLRASIACRRRTYSCVCMKRTPALRLSAETILHRALSKSVFAKRLRV